MCFGMNGRLRLPREDASAIRLPCMTVPIVERSFALAENKPKQEQRGREETEIETDNE